MFSYGLSFKWPKKIGFWLKIALFAGLIAYVGHVLRQQRFDWLLVRQQLRAVEHPERWAAVLLLLTPVNWGFEALKWQILLRRVERTTFRDAYRAVLVGLSLGFALPAQLGDTAGRVLSLRTDARAGAIGASLVSGGMQFYVALVFGAVAWAYHLTVALERDTVAGRWLLVLLTGLSGLGILFGLVRRGLIGWLSTRPPLRRFASYWDVAGQYDDREIELALGAATVRYLIFSAQFYMAMRLVGIGLPPDISASGIGVVFLVKTVMPAFNLLSDLSVREAAALWVFAPFGPSAGAVSVLITATLTLWIANILMPVLVGLMWVWRLKWSVNNR